MLFQQLLEIDDPEPHSAPLNMALDEALLLQAVAPTLRIYGWREPAVSLGYFSRYDEARTLAGGRAMVRRWTGGGLVEHGDDLTYTLIVPRTDAFFQINPVESYRMIHEKIAQWLSGRGIASEVAPSSAAESSGACFVSHVRYDLVAGPRKLAGAAQRRTRWGLLHQGSIQLVEKKNLPPTAPATLAKAFAPRSERTHISSDLLHSATQIADQRYATDTWLRKF